MAISSHSDIWKIHEAACERNESFYLDPESGFQVFTEFGLKQRGRCCGSGCRHCPYAHVNVPEERRAKSIQQPSWLTPADFKDSPVDALFWSGGKDSFLTLRKLQAESNDRQIVLVTTFDALRRRIAHQELDLEDIIRQSEFLKLPLLGIPLHAGRDYNDSVVPGLNLVPNLKRLVFGDLHLEHIRDWREEAFRRICEVSGIELAFPLWRADYGKLIDDLEESGVVCEISAIESPELSHLKIGTRFDRSLMEHLPENVDKFGENGEFHTLVRVWEMP